MAIVRHTYMAGSGLSPEQIAEIEEAEKYPIVFDEDSPELTDEQLAEFQPVHFSSWEERAKFMQAERDGKVYSKDELETILKRNYVHTEKEKANDKVPLSKHELVTA